ncbi:MAG: cytochrome b/b6 domain-containing protein [Alphaproteobacteria bacterium]
MTEANPETVYVWDPFVRIAHWAVVAGFAVAFLTEDEALRLHVWAGYLVGCLVALRVLWGFLGPRHARFSDFIYRPRKVVRYIVDLLTFRAARHLGHSPAGGAMVVALLLCLGATVGTGLVDYAISKGAGPLAGIVADTAADRSQKVSSSTYTATAGDEGEKSHRKEGRRRGSVWRGIHETFANLTLMLVIVHIGGVFLASIVHRENLVRAMISGRKRR